MQRVPSEPRARPSEGSPGNDEGPRPGGRGPVVSAVGQRQRIDMTRPATMAPNPIAKFQAPSEVISGMRSPAT